MDGLKEQKTVTKSDIEYLAEEEVEEWYKEQLAQHPNAEVFEE